MSPVLPDTMAPGPRGWDDAMLVAAIVVVAPAGLGVRVCLPTGPERDGFLALVRSGLAPGTPMRRCPPGIDEERLLGGLDLAATLAARRRITRPGLLEASDGGVLVLPMAERAPPALAARLAAALEEGEIVGERADAPVPARFALLLLDEGVSDDPPPPAALLDRIGLTLGMPERGPVAPPVDFAVLVKTARARLPSVSAPDAITEAMCRAALAAGIVSLRAPLLALRVARVVAALDGASTVTAEHAAIAARLVLAPRSAALSSAETVAAADTPDADQQATPAEVGSRNGNGDAGLDGERSEPCSVPGAVEEMGGSDPDGIVLEAARAALPAGLLQQLGGGSAQRKTSRVATGRTEGVRAGRGTPPRRGRRIGTMPGDPARARLDLLGTIRAALPWQTLRQAELPAIAGDAAGPLRVRRADFRVFRFAPRLRLVTIILLDASGSAARARLADAKGCVSVLLADCYARRDQVALIGCRNRDASLLLPPTGSVVRARRALDSLPGGGGTPLAAGLDAALLLAGRVRREGGTPRLLLLTDARANVARDGRADRTRAMQEAMEAARAIRAVALPALLVDISARPRATGPGSDFTSSSAAAALAEAMGARSLSLGRGDADLPVRTAAALHAVEPGTGHG